MGTYISSRKQIAPFFFVWNLILNLQFVYSDRNRFIYNLITKRVANVWIESTTLFGLFSYANSDAHLRIVKHWVHFWEHVEINLQLKLVECRMLSVHWIENDCNNTNKIDGFLRYRSMHKAKRRRSKTMSNME